MRALGRTIVRQAAMLVEDLMTRQPPVCRRSQSLVAAVRLMCEHDLAAVPVLDAESKLVGVLSVNDLVRWEARRSRSRRWAKTLQRPVLVAQVMTHETIGVSVGESIADAARVMRYINRSVLPVLDPNGMLVGIVSAADVASASVRTDESIRLDVQKRLTQLRNPAIAALPSVHVESGSVILTGVSGSRRDMEAVRRSVATVTGVVGIHIEPHAGVRTTAD
ncbi:MAG: CBS domain-containing protein [Actinomycetota bacterium]